MKVLISAYACSPYKGSEPGVGWGFVAELAKHHELWVIVEEEKFREDIELYLSGNPAFSKNVHFYFLKKKRNRLLRRIWPPSYYWYYRRWHRDAFDLAIELHREFRFDITHQLTMVGYREPGYLWKLDIPFVWGPVGGMGVFPWAFIPQLGLRGALYYLGYNLFSLWQIHFSRRPRLAARATKGRLLTVTPENQRGAKQHWGCTSTLMTEVGFPPLLANKPCARSATEPLRIVWTGLHIPRKALNIALKALVGLPAGVRWELHILGDGPLAPAWRKLAKTLGIADRCHFHGWQPRGEALAIMKSAHMLLITSLRDLTSTVTIEGLSLGLPIICLDHCGFAGVVNDSCGIKVPVTRPSKTVRGLVDAITKLALDEPRRQRLAQGAIDRAQNFSWEIKIEILNRIYDRAIREAGRTAL